MPKSGLTKKQRAYMGDTMDSVGRIFEFEQLSFEAFEQCRTAGDIAAYLHDEMDRWMRIGTDSSNDDFELCLESFNREMRWYLRLPATGDDLDRPLTELFACKRKRLPMHKIEHWYYILSSKFLRTVPDLSRKHWVKPTAKRSLVVYAVYFATIMLLIVLESIGLIVLPDSALVLGSLFLLLLSPLIVICVTSCMPWSLFYTNPEPGLTLRTMLVRYANKLGELHGECDLEYIQSQLLKNWDSESCEPGTLDSPVPWLDK